MSRMKVLAVLAVVLMVGVVYAQQQTMPPGQQRTTAQPRPGTPRRRCRTSRRRSNNRMPTWRRRSMPPAARPKARPSARPSHCTVQYTGGTPGQQSGQSATGQGQNLVAHVFVVADNQLKNVIVDAKDNKVLNVETRQMFNHPWMSREREGGMGTGGSSGQSGQSGMDSGSQAQSGQQGQTLRERAGMSDISMLRLETAQRIVKCADQDNITLQKAIDFASSQAKGASSSACSWCCRNMRTSGPRRRTAAVHLGPAGERVCQGLCRGRQPAQGDDHRRQEQQGPQHRDPFDLHQPVGRRRMGQSGMGGTSGQQRQQQGQGSSAASREQRRAVPDRFGLAAAAPARWAASSVSGKDKGSSVAMPSQDA